MVASLGLASGSVGAPVSARLCIRFGCRIIMVCSGLLCALGLVGSSFAPNLYVLYLSFGILVGCASSMVYQAGYQTIPLYFDKHSFVAASLASMGFAAGFLVMCPITQVLLDHFGWRKALLLMAGINVIPVILGCTITRKNISKRDEEDTSQPSEKRCSCLRLLDLHVFKDPMFVILTISIVTAMLGSYMPYMHLVNMFNIVLNFMS